MADDFDVYILSSSSNEDTSGGNLTQKFNFTSASSSLDSPVEDTKHDIPRTIQRARGKRSSSSGRGRGPTRRRKSSTKNNEQSSKKLSVQDSPIAKLFNRSALRKSVDGTSPVSSGSTCANSPCESSKRDDIFPHRDDNHISRNTVTYSAKHSKGRGGKANVKNTKTPSAKASSQKRSPILEAFGRMNCKKPPTTQQLSGVVTSLFTNDKNLDSSLEEVGSGHGQAQVKDPAVSGVHVKQSYQFVEVPNGQSSQTTAGNKLVYSDLATSGKRPASTFNSRRTPGSSGIQPGSVINVGSSSPSPVIEEASSDDDFELPSFIPASGWHRSSLSNKPTTTESRNKHARTHSTPKQCKGAEPKHSHNSEVSGNDSGDSVVFNKQWASTNASGKKTKIGLTDKTEAPSQSGKSTGKSCVTTVTRPLKKTSTSAKARVDDDDSSDDFVNPDPKSKRKRKTPRRNPLKLLQQEREPSSFRTVQPYSKKDSVIEIITASSSEEDMNKSVTVIPESDGESDKSDTFPIISSLKRKATDVGHVSLPGKLDVNKRAENNCLDQAPSVPEGRPVSCDTQNTNRQQHIGDSSSSESDVDLETLLKSKRPMVKRIVSEDSSSSPHVRYKSKTQVSTEEAIMREGQPLSSQKQNEYDKFQEDETLLRQPGNSNTMPVINKQVAKKSLTHRKRIFSPVQNGHMFNRIKKKKVPTATLR